MAERVVAERMIRELHAARVGGDLAALCRLFADHGQFEIVGASADKAKRLALFDQATGRQRDRESARPRDPQGDGERGWTREELYERHGAG